MPVAQEAVYHRPKSSYAYAFDEETIHIRLRSKRGDLDDCRLLHADKFDWPDSSELTPMALVHRDRDHDYWQLAVTPENRRLCYAFRLESGDESLWLTEWGFESANENELPTMGATRPLHYFEYSFLNPADIIDPPEWVGDAVFYQIFPERFENGDPENDPEGVEEWGGTPQLDNFFGGDLQGIIDHLDYIEDLGVTALYLTPIFQSNTNHKYNITDYERIDPQFGDKETLQGLVDEANSRGVRVVLDAVFNHCGRQFEPFQDVVENGAESEYADWFHVHEFPIQFEPQPSYDAWGFESHMPKLNTEHPEVRAYLIDVATDWMEETGIDGWRLDVADEVDHGFWREFREAVKSVNPEAYVLGEIWHDARPWLRGDQFDGVMNYQFTYAIHDFINDETIDGAAFVDKVGRFLFRYPDQTNEVQFNLLGSHDTPRLLHRCDGDKQRLRLSMLLLMSSLGVPCVYYGDEVGMTGGDDPDCRRTMVWDESEQDTELRQFFSDLIACRTETHALRRGTMRFDREQCTEDVVVFRRTTGRPSSSVTVAVNRGNEAVEIELVSESSQSHETLFETATDEIERVDDHRYRLPAMSGVVWK